jgi:hypothetical protein
MLAPNKEDLGNLARIYHELARDNAERENFIRAADERAGPFGAELVRDVTPRWHAARCVGGLERSAAGFLIGRRFGIYLPEFDYEDGKPLSHPRVLIPGYVFVYVWDIERHERRIRACPGVLGFLLEGSHIAEIPWDGIGGINWLRAVENAHRKPLTVTIEEIVRKKGKYRPRRGARRMVIGPDDIVATHSYSPYLAEQSTADKAAPQAAIKEVRALFARAMGLEGLTESAA